MDGAVFWTGEEHNLLDGFGWYYAIMDMGCNKSIAGLEQVQYVGSKQELWHQLELCWLGMW